MKRFILAIALTAAAGLASAGDKELAAVHVQSSNTATECTPPNSDLACAGLHAAIRANFSKREIGMLFGAATSYPEFGTSYARVQERYARFLRDVESGNQSVALAAK